MTMSDRLADLTTYAASPTATAGGVAARANRLDDADWDAILGDTTALVPLPADGRAGLEIGDGGEGWSILWWDAAGRRVVARRDYGAGEWAAEADERPWPEVVAE
jgi:hypothetical protein